MSFLCKKNKRDLVCTQLHIRLHIIYKLADPTNVVFPYIEWRSGSDPAFTSEAVELFWDFKPWIFQMWCYSIYCIYVYWILYIITQATAYFGATKSRLLTLLQRIQNITNDVRELIFPITNISDIRRGNLIRLPRLDSYNTFPKSLWDVNLIRGRFINGLKTQTLPKVNNK